MKKLFTLLVAIGLVGAASAQTGHRNDSRSNNSYQGSPYSSNDRGHSRQYSDRDQYNRNSQWNDHGNNNQYDRDRQWAEKQRYDMMMKNRQAQYYNQKRYTSHSSTLRIPVFGLLSQILR